MVLKTVAQAAKAAGYYAGAAGYKIAKGALIAGRTTARAAKTVGYKIGTAGYKTGSVGLRSLGKVPLKVPRAGGKYGAQVEINRTVLAGEAIARKAAETRDAGKALGYYGGAYAYKGATRFLRFQRGRQQSKMSAVGQKAAAKGRVMALRVREFAGHVGQGTPRWQQMIAAILLPFILVAGAAIAQVVLQILLDFVPAGFIATDFIRFLLGTFLFIGVFAFGFGWVKTGGFKLFA